MIRVLIVDDEPLIRHGFSMILGAQPDLAVVGEAADGLEALRQAAATDPDVVLLDVRMPHLDGIEVTRRLAAAATRHKILLLTTFDVDEYAFDGLRAGASGFLLKNALPAELVSAIRAVAAGDAVIAPSTTRRLLERIAPHLPSSTSSGTTALSDSLTPRERDVLRLLASGLSNAEIAADLSLSDATVKTHVAHILTKLGVRDRVQAVIYAYENSLHRA